MAVARKTWRPASLLPRKAGSRLLPTQRFGGKGILEAVDGVSFSRVDRRERKSE